MYNRKLTIDLDNTLFVLQKNKPSTCLSLDRFELDENSVPTTNKGDYNTVISAWLGIEDALCNKSLEFDIQLWEAQNLFEHLKIPVPAFA